jgi:hypothetical protein
MGDPRSNFLAADQQPRGHGIGCDFVDEKGLFFHDAIT